MNELIKFDVELDSEIKSVSVPLIEYKERPILLSYQLANLFGIEPKSINSNFNNNISEFDMDDDYYVLESTELQNFKNYLKNMSTDSSQFSSIVDNVNKASRLYLWTEEGVANHAKISNSKNAWKIFKVIKKYYFKNKNENQIVVLRNQLSSVMQNMITLSDSVNTLTNVVKSHQPIVVAYNQFMSSQNYLDIEAVAKSISDIHNKVIGKNTLLDYLRKKQIFTKSNLPYQQYINNKLFSVHVKVYDDGQKYSTAVVTSRGIAAIIKSLKNDKLL